jgi:hypothetical protein
MMHMIILDHAHNAVSIFEFHKDLLGTAIFAAHEKLQESFGKALVKFVGCNCIYYQTRFLSSTVLYHCTYIHYLLLPFYSAYMSWWTCDWFIWQGAISPYTIYRGEKYYYLWSLPQCQFYGFMALFRSVSYTQREYAN